LSQRMNSNKDAQPAPTKRRFANPWLIIVAALFIIVPFLTWYTTWFGRTLTDDDIAKYLAEEKNPRHVQHALAQIESRMEKRDTSAKKFYPQVVALAKSPTGEIRKTVAWVMGQDVTSTEFHQGLLSLMTDTEPLVRRNAALQLVRFGDAAGRSELLAMLKPFEAKSVFTGTVVSLLPQGSNIKVGSLVGRVRDSTGVVQEFRSPVPGAISTLSVKEGAVVSTGQTVAFIAPDRATVSDALRALAYVGTKDDLPVIDSCAQANAGSDIAQQAALTAKGIRARTAN
jgi:hypothetical protein